MKMNRRTARKNKQRMYYALYLGSTTDYVLDSNGNKIVDGYDEDGKPLYRETGTESPVYGTPVPFSASISGNLSEIHAREYGVSQNSIYSEIQCVKGYLPLKYGAIIWKDSTPNVTSINPSDSIVPSNNLIIQGTDGNAQTASLDYTNADYTVTGVLDEFIHYDWFLLRRND